MKGQNLTSRRGNLAHLILPKEVEAGRVGCCTRPWSETHVWKLVVAQWEYGFGFALLGHLVKSQFQRLSQKPVQSIGLFQAQIWGRTTLFMGSCRLLCTPYSICLQLLANGTVSHCYNQGAMCSTGVHGNSGAFSSSCNICPRATSIGRMWALSSVSVGRRYVKPL